MTKTGSGEKGKNTDAGGTVKRGKAKRGGGSIVSPSICKETEGSWAAEKTSPREANEGWTGGHRGRPAASWWGYGAVAGKARKEGGGHERRLTARLDL